MIVYLSLEQVLLLHEKQLEVFCGPPGLRDRAGLESAVARPQMTFAGEDLYPDLSDKAAALMHSLVSNHPFVDGNKRVGAMAAELFLAVDAPGRDTCPLGKPILRHAQRLKKVLRQDLPLGGWAPAPSPKGRA